jgi:hypothetical protein
MMNTSMNNNATGTKDLVQRACSAWGLVIWLLLSIEFLPGCGKPTTVAVASRSLIGLYQSSCRAESDFSQTANCRSRNTLSHAVNY